MKRLGAIVSVVVCAVVFPGFCAGQEGTQPDKTPRAAIETKSLVQGRVVQEPGGQGIRKVRVILRGGREQLEATTDERGEFKIPGLEPGIYFVAQLERSGQLAVGARSDRFRDYYTKSVLLGGREVADTGFPVSSSAVLDVVVSARGATIEGSVVDENGKPVASATVVTVPSSGKLGRPDAYQSGVSEENGHFLLRGLNPGGFFVLAFEGMQEDVRSPESRKSIKKREKRSSWKRAEKRA